jgi:ABC-type microcin C transport system permease subunit YejE
VVQDPVNTGVVFEVMLSVFEVPVSLPAVMSGAVAGAVGAVVSIVIERLLEATEMFPAVSVCLAFIVACVPCERAEEVIVTVEATHVPVPTNVTLS